jgi:hypothetical protein
MTISPSAQLITNAVVAEYIHEISARHHSRDPEPGTVNDQSGQTATPLNSRPRQPLALRRGGLATGVQPG